MQQGFALLVIQLNIGGLDQAINFWIGKANPIEGTKAKLRVIGMRIGGIIVIRLTSQGAPTGHDVGKLAPCARREDHRRRLARRLHFKANARQHLRHRRANTGITRQAIIGEIQHHAKAIRIARFGQKLPRAVDIGGRDGQRRIEAEDTRCHHLADRRAKPFHGNFRERASVNGKVNRLPHTRIAIRVRSQARPIARRHLRRRFALVQGKVEDIDCLGFQHSDVTVAFKGRDIGGRHAHNHINLAGAKLRHARGGVGDFTPHHAAPSGTTAPVIIAAFHRELLTRGPG